MRTTEQRAVVSSKLFPGSMEVIGHHIDEVQIPGEKEEKTMPLNIIAKHFFSKMYFRKDTHLAISAISYPASMVPFPADTAAVTMS